MPARKTRHHTRGKPAVAVVVSRYNGTVTGRLLEGARRAFSRRAGGRLTVIEVPGSFELPVVCRAAARTGCYDGVLALGCVIKGETIHDEVIAHAVAGALAQVSIETGVPVSLGVLTVRNTRQAMDRAGGRFGNKGEQAMEALLDAITGVRAASRGLGCLLDGPMPDKATPSSRGRRG
jgi:6,7-dimethyl-8-ribityllumazine synthase